MSKDDNRSAPKLKLPSEDIRGLPGYWRAETSGVLKPAIEAYLNSEPMTADEIRIMQAYLRQWIDAPVWAGDPGLRWLRWEVRRIRTREDIREWLERALAEGHDPL